MSALPRVAAVSSGTLAPYVLIAEYDLHRAAIYAQLVNDEGLEALVSRDGREATAIVNRRGAPALLILELSLPFADGLAVLTDVRASLPAGTCPAIVLSASDALRSTAWRMREHLGIEAVLPRDVSWALLRSTVATALVHLGHHGQDDTQGPQTPQASLQRVVMDASQAFCVPIAVAYARLSQRELFAAHVSMEGPVVGFELSQQWSFLHQVVAAGEPIVVPDARAHPLFRDQVTTGRAGVRGFVGAPIVHLNGTTFGAVCLVDTNVLSLSVHDLDGLRALGRRAGGELERRVDAQQGGGDADPSQFSELSRLALTDPLTGLVNRRGGEKSIEREVSRARRNAAPLSLMLLDVDRFKSINDTHGHAAGDRALREVGQGLQEMVRGSDLAIRWGGDEFLLVLPGVDGSGARTLAERIRARVESLQVPGLGQLTISAGLAEFTEGQAFEEVLALADTRLYQAKSGGRNRVE